MLRACRAILGTQKLTSYNHNACTGVSDWAQSEYNMHKKKLCLSDMMVYAAMYMVKDMVNACLCKGVKNYSFLHDLLHTFEKSHKEMNECCDRELVWVLGE